MEKDLFVIGKHALKELLKVKPQTLIKIYSCKKEDPLLDEAKKWPIKMIFASKKKLDQMVLSSSHQGFVALIRKRPYLSARAFLDQLEQGPFKKDPCCVLMCDGIFDPQNLGAILRAGECFGAHGLVYSKNRGVDITPVVTKASVGASELLPLIRVSNLADTVTKFQNAGFMVVAAEAGKGLSLPLTSFFFQQRVLLILGSEGKGIRALLRKRADACLEIPLKGQISSLNVSQAAAIFLFHWNTQWFK